MKKILLAATAIVILAGSSCSTVDSVPTDKLVTMYEKRINRTSIFNKLFFNDHKKKKIVYENVDIYLNEESVGKPFETVAFGTYMPFTIPLLRPYNRSIIHNFLYKAARTAYKMNADAVVIDGKGLFRVINYKNRS